MRLRPNLASTVAHWPFQGSLVDTSGNGLNVITLGWGTPGTINAPGGVEQYGAIDSCVQGFKFNATTKLLAASSALFRMTGPYTISFILNQAAYLGGNQVWACCANPNRFGGGGGSANAGSGSLYTYYWTNDHLGQAPYYADNAHTGANYIIPPADPVVWGIQTAHLYHLRHNGDGTIDGFCDGVKHASAITSVGLAVVGNERLYIGGCDSTFNDAMSNLSLLADYRVDNAALSDSAIAAEAAYSTSPCTAFIKYRGVTMRFKG